MEPEVLAAALGWPLAALTALGALGLRHRLGAHLVRVAEASHELRGPLTTARLALEGLGGDARRAAAIELELRRAGLALDDLAGVGEAAPRRDPVEVGALLVEATEAWRSLARAFGAELRVQAAAGELWVRADRLRLAQACGNLVANAVEHGGGDVRVRARVSALGVRIEVSDGGPGPSALVLAGAHGPRRRGGAGAVAFRRRRGGVHAVPARGHGLAIAARVARAHGGRLLAEEGRVALELPVAAR